MYVCIFLLLYATLYNCLEIFKKKRAYAEIVILVAVHCYLLLKLHELIFNWITSFEADVSQRKNIS